jgi:hypothetical protein
MPTHRDTVPLPLALHLAMYVVIGLFCMFAGPLNLIDPTKIFFNGVLFLGAAGLAWGYVFGVFMGRREAVIISYALSGFCLGMAGWLLGKGDVRLAAVVAFVGLYGLVTMLTYRRWVMTS